MNFEYSIIDSPPPTLLFDTLPGRIDEGAILIACHRNKQKQRSKLSFFFVQIFVLSVWRIRKYS